MTAQPPRKQTVRIITDTTAVLPPEFIAAHHLEVIPQIIIFGEESFDEDYTITYTEFVRRLKTSPQLPKTAAPRPGDFVAAFGRELKNADTLICIHPSSDVSGTVRSALTAKESSYPDADIRIIDTRTIGACLASIVIDAVQWAESGVPADEIERRVRSMITRGRTFFLVSTLEYLAKGGRIGGAASLLGSVLQIKPILQVQDGHIEPLEKVRSQNKARERLVELVVEKCPHKPEAHLSVMHADVLADAEELAATLRQQTGIQDIPIYSVGSAITTHGGPGVLGIGFFAD